MEKDETRISSVDRAEALSSLSDHFEAGRLHSFEYEDRRGRLGDATVRSELDALFTDLPALDAAGVAVPVPVASTADRPGLAKPASIARPSSQYRRCLSAGTCSWLPLLATALFLLTRQWVWFLLIPAAGLVANSKPRSRCGATREPHEARS